jgi:hypothetical protein
MQDQITVDGKVYSIKPVLEKYFTIYTLQNNSLFWLL